MRTLWFTVRSVGSSVHKRIFILPIFVVVMILFVSLWLVDDYYLVYVGLCIDYYFFIYYGFEVELC
jgi:hypothetical protein